MIAIAWWAALAVSGAELSAPLSIEARSELAWRAVVAATPTGSRAPRCEDAVLRALLLRGATCDMARSGGGSTLALEGPPGLEQAMIDALSALTPRDGALFVEGTPRDARGPRARPVTARSPACQAQTGAPAGAAAVVLPLAPSASLFGLEGELLVRAAEAALQRAAPGARATLEVDAGAALLRLELPGLEGDAAVDQARAALAPLADRPPPPQQLLAWLTAAQSAVARRHGEVGARARDRAAAWLCTGSAELTVDGDLGARLRARIIVQALTWRPSAAAPAAASARAPAPTTR